MKYFVDGVLCKDGTPFGKAPTRLDILDINYNTWTIGSLFNQGKPDLYLKGEIKNMWVYLAAL